MKTCCRQLAITSSTSSTSSAGLVMARAWSWRASDTQTTDCAALRRQIGGFVYPPPSPASRAPRAARPVARYRPIALAPPTHNGQKGPTNPGKRRQFGRAGAPTCCSITATVVAISLICLLCPLDFTFIVVQRHMSTGAPRAVLWGWERAGRGGFSPFTTHVLHARRVLKTYRPGVRRREWSCGDWTVGCRVAQMTHATKDLELTHCSCKRWPVEGMG